MKIFFMRFTHNLACFFFTIYVLLNIQSGWSSNAHDDICSNYTGQYSKNKVNPEPAVIPYRTGLLWEIKNKKGDISHIFGTMHSQDRMVTQIHPYVRLALHKSNRLVMEIVPNNESNQIFSKALFFTDDNNLEDLIENEIYSRIENRITDYGIDISDTRRLKPWAAFTILGRPRPVNAPTLEMILMQIAIETNHEIVGLETMDELIMILDSIAMPDQIEILYDTVCNQDKIIRDTKKLVNLYFERDLAGIMAFNEQPHHDEEVYKRFIQKMLIERNLKIITRIEQHINSSRAFIAIGALHLPGENGLLSLLGKKGYAISVVY